MPQPDGPSRLKNSPYWTSRLMWSTATASPKRLTTSTSRTSTVGTFVRTPAWDDAPRPPARLGCGARIWARSAGVKDANPVARAARIRARFAPSDAPSTVESVDAPATRIDPAAHAPTPRYDIDATNVRTTLATPRRDPTADAQPHPRRRHRRHAHRPGARARARPRHPRHGQERRHRRLRPVDDHRADDAGLSAQGRDRADDPRRAGRDRRDPGRHHLGRDGPPVAAAPGRAAGARASRTSSPSRPARAGSARARSASTSRSRWPRPARRSACSTPTSRVRTSR